MARLILEFPIQEAADDFAAWLCDGGGQDSYQCMPGHLKIDYRRCFPAWGYDPADHGPDKVIEFTEWV